MRQIACLFVLSVFFLVPAKAGDTVFTALVGGTVIDGTGAEPRENMTVLIDGNRIRAVGASGSIKLPEGTKRIDVSGKYVLPGFIDVHFHTTFASDSSITSYAEAQSGSLATIRAIHFMGRSLKAGVTSVRDTGASVEPMQALLRGRELGFWKSTRLYPVGQLITTIGGHGGQDDYYATGPYGFRNAVRKMFDAGFGHIKLSPMYTEEEITAAIDEARKLGMRVTTHGGGGKDTLPTSMTKIAVLAGTQCIEHLNPMDESVLDLIAERGVHIVPTLEVYKRLYEAGFMEGLKKTRGWALEIHENLFKKAMARNIIMGVGTDLVPPFMDEGYPGGYFDEMKYFVRLGMSRMDAIKAATMHGAIILGKEDELGTIEAGKLADIQVVSGDPLKSFDNLGNPEIVMVGGERLH